MTRRSLAVIAALALTAGSAGAQFGIMKKVQEKAAKAAVKKAGLGPSYKTPTFTDEMLEITPERVDKLLAGLRAESTFAITAAKNQKDYAKAQAAEQARYVEARRKYDEDMKAWNAKKMAAQQQMMAGMAQQQNRAACVREANGGSMRPPWFTPELEQKLMSMSEAEQRAWGAKAQRLGEKAKAAKDRGDMKTANVYLDSLSAFTGISKPDLMRAFESQQKIDKCAPGADMNAMKANMSAMTDLSDMPKEPQPPRDMDPGGELSTQMNAAGAKAAGLTLRQWDLMRERVQSLLMYGDTPPAGTELAFSDVEVKAVLAKRGEISVYSEYLTGNAPSWVWNSSR